jgi:decaprenylphospho-beta-D-erythro-pentofuranosid-2-ulose 2-reductase
VPAAEEPDLSESAVRTSVGIKRDSVCTPMTAHLRRSFLFASAEQTGREVYNAMISPRAVVYCPWYWKWIMRFIRFIPNPIFAKLNL